MSEQRDKEAPADDELFREAIGGVKPLPQDRAEPHHARRRPVPLDRPTDDDATDGLAEGSGETPEFLDFMRPGVQRRLYDDLRRGLIPPRRRWTCTACASARRGSPCCASWPSHCASNDAASG